MTRPQPHNTPASDSSEPASLWPRWFAAAAQPALAAAVHNAYQRLDDAIRQRGPTCWASGRCCNFEAYGHRLYVTGLEIAWMLRELRGSNPAVPPPASQVDPRGGCPFQTGKLCSVHTIRPLGCRIFFCQEGTQDWQHEVYERFLAQLRTLHDAQDLPYRYMEWRTGLKEALIWLEAAPTRT